jgi:hypothetical protein
LQKGISFGSIAMPHTVSNASSLSNLLIQTDAAYRSKANRKTNTILPNKF